MTSEIAAAAERMSMKQPGDEYFWSHGGIGTKYLDDLKVIARAYLAEHPADDAELVTEEWLRSVGWKQWDAIDGNDDFDLWLPANRELGWPCRLAWCSNGIYVVRMVSDEEDYLGVAESVELLDSRNRKKTITRGDVRALLRALKITLTEKDAHVQ